MSSVESMNHEVVFLESLNIKHHFVSFNVQYYLLNYCLCFLNILLDLEFQTWEILFDCHLNSMVLSFFPEYFVIMPYYWTGETS